LDWNFGDFWGLLAKGFLGFSKKGKEKKGEFREQKGGKGKGFTTRDLNWLGLLN